MDNKEQKENIKIQVKLPREVYQELQKYVDKEHSMAKVIRYFIKKGINNDRKEND